MLGIYFGCRSGGDARGKVLWGEAPSGPVKFTEHGVKFMADVVEGQKTGFFLDQRENRKLMQVGRAGDGAGTRGRGRGGGGRKAGGGGTGRSRGREKVGGAGGGGGKRGVCRRGGRA